MILVLGAFALTGVSAIGARSGWWPATEAIRTNDWSTGLAAAGLLVSLVARFRRGRRGNGLAVAAVLLAAAFLATVANDSVRAGEAPGLKDVSTDLADPPRLSGPLRADLHAGLETGNRPGFEALTPAERWRVIHAEAYPDLRPLILPLPPAEALRRTEQAIAEQGWTIRHRSADTIEAEARTRLFGLRDAVAVRVRPEGQGSRVDLRSVRLEGPHDRGQGISNIRRLKAALQQP